ncbi:DUF6309 family protein [Nocardiopsis ganjiahuensis]|uniref:DUF6309 family protein n=1 Tax=Nocardiopsis ganjiahuensis TaxID=239984 RepID=UPI000345C560|nr:DUF6309 family protein [Nocardiopsis ganjiahuensis]
MKIIEPVTTEEVLETFRRTGPPHDDITARDAESYAEKMTLLAVEQHGEPWYRVRLSRKDVLAVVLPWHRGENGELELVPPTGATVQETLTRLSAWGDEYPTANPLCWEKLHRHSDTDLSPLILSAGVVDHPHYADLSDRDSLTHLDGLHRMLAWGLEGRLPRFRRLDAYVVGLNRY